MRPKLQERNRAASPTLLANVLLVIAMPSIRSQSQDPQKPGPEPEVQQLKDRQKQLEQNVDELKGQINSIEDSQKQSAAVAEGVPASARIPSTAANTNPGNSFWR